MRRTLRRILRIAASSYRAVERGGALVAAVVIMFMVFLTAADITGRYVFNSPIMGAYEVVQVMLVAVVFLAIAHVQATKGHVKIEAFTSWMPERGRLALDIFGYMVALFIMAVITYNSGTSAWIAWVTKDYAMGAIEIPYWPGKTILTFGASLLCLRLIGDIIVDSARLLRGVTK